ncbi:MAG: uracil-xanthine permease, partial [Clostridia bacterium]|nr:uracil-xanthine permease [Clostridia bacterium]
ACAGLVYLALAGLIKIFGAKKVMRFVPPIVTGPIIIAIGLTLSSSAIGNCSSNWLIAVIAIAIIIICNIFGKGMIKIIPIMLGVLGSSAIAVILDLTTSMEIFDPAKLEAFKAAAWVGLPFHMKDTVFGLLSSDFDKNLLVSAVITIMPISLATMVEHIGDISAISSTCKRNYIADPGLHRTLLGDGVATTLAALFGAPANTTYGENTGVLSLSKVFDPKVVRIAAYLAVLFSFSPKFAALVSLMPTATIGGASLVLYGMISAVGVRNVVENKVNFENTRNVIIAALILVLSIGINYAGAIQIPVGSVTISLSGLAVGALVGIILNAILPGKDYEFGTDEKGDKSVNFKV